MSKQSIIGLALSLAFVLPGSAQARRRPAKPDPRVALGSWQLLTWRAKSDPHASMIDPVAKLTLWRRACDIEYQLTYKRLTEHKVKLRLQLRFQVQLPNPRPPPRTRQIVKRVITPWRQTRKVGPGVQTGRVPTWECWIRGVRQVSSPRLQVAVVPPPKTQVGSEVLGVVIFNKWGRGGDVYYRTIMVWRDECKLRYRFRYKRRTAARRRMRFTLIFDVASLPIPWHVSKQKGEREISGAIVTKGCWSQRASRFRAQFESERY